MSQIKGTAASASSTPPSLTEQLAEQNPHYIPKTAQGCAIVDEFLTGHDEVEIPDTKTPYDLPTGVKNLIQKQVTESLQALMRNILVLIDASIPNKDQNRAVKKFIQKEFDSAFVESLKDTDPYNSGSYVAATVLGNITP